MATSYVISPISDVIGTRPVVSRFAREIAQEHQAYFGGRRVLNAPDPRTALAPSIGATIREPGLAATWARFDKQYLSEARISRFWITEVEQAVVHPPFGIISVGDQLIRDTIRAPEQLLSIFPNVAISDLRSAMSSSDTRLQGVPIKPNKNIPGCSFLLGFGVFENYFNWTIRYASRIAFYQAQNNSTKLIIPDLRKLYISQTLELFGVQQDECISLRSPVLCERLILVSPIALGRYELSPLIAENLRSHRRISALWRQKKRPLYIPRRNVSMRSVVNEAEVETVLRDRGFQIFDNAEYSVQEQVRAFRNASMVVAPHGAGLANIAYCDPKTPIIEVVPEGYDQGVTSYRSMADLFGLRYSQKFAREIKMDRRRNRCNSDIEIDIAELRDEVALLENNIVN